MNLKQPFLVCCKKKKVMKEIVFNSKRELCISHLSQANIHPFKPYFSTSACLWS